ncbi:hypothetical protein K431DRAFT_287552 [Polychaeton citri CBS 116435]|uniref:X-Pro dipeptidyl-peptidase n=1 Tax=Polychaeton citri CBS 116435 TaxID=1314669 RepID=A0A9P4Q549_9PEZI|nr:hypothetical protein K431DRAFT_287552 [Polychaeton citri CBS 116435]
MVRNIPIRHHDVAASNVQNDDDSAEVDASQPPISHAVRILAMEIQADVKDLEAFYNISISPTRILRLRRYMTTKLSELEKLPFQRLIQEARVDYVLLRNYLRRQIRSLNTDESRNEELQPLFEHWMPSLIDLLERRQKVTATEGQFAASVLASANSHITKLKTKISNGKLKLKDSFAAFRAANALQEIHMRFTEWHAFYSGYNPTFTWWISHPWTKLQTELLSLRSTIRTVLVGISDSESGDADDAIVGQPIGRSGLLHDLSIELIPYSPEQLCSIGEKEYAWCEREMVLASRKLGYGEDWGAALEHVKDLYQAPGSQPEMVYALAREAIEYVGAGGNDMVTIPALCAETWRTYMMSPAAQRVNPFFLGGPYIQVSYPTDAMSHEEKVMSLRANSRPFSRATVFHELIPGHHLQWHFMDRYKTYRAELFSTPFWIEGWAFYWEFILWDRGFAATPEDKIGMLFWRMHRCARILFSINFHLGKWTPQECIDFLVEKVGHERATAEGEVRRSLNGDYSPLYQAGYMLGALQLYALRKEMVDGGEWTEKAFHDRILRENQMSVEMLRALLRGEELTADYEPQWRFYDDREKELDSSLPR